MIRLREPQLGLQVEPDGRRSWALGRDTGDPANLPEIGALEIDKGSLHFVASEHGADIRRDLDGGRGRRSGARPLGLRTSSGRTASAALPIAP